MPAKRIAGPKYREIHDALKKEILSGDRVAGERLPSESELTASFGVSRLTVNRALSELQLAGLIERRVGSGSYVRNVTAKGLTFGLLIPELGETEIFEPICRGMALAQQSENHVLLWGRSLADAHSGASSAEETCQQLIAKRIAGVFFAPLELTPDRDRVNQEIVALFEEALIPIVLLDRDLVPFPGRSRYDLVGIDNRRAGHLVSQHLMRQGCRRLAFIAHRHAAPTVDARIAGFRDAHDEAGVSFLPEQILRTDLSDQDRLMQFLRQAQPDGVVCANDFTAARVMKVLQETAPEVLSRVRIAGIDDVKYASLLPVPLTTIRQPCAEIGAAAVTTMFQRLQAPAMPARDVLLKFQLIVRESCRPRSN